jgi:dCMP deaminase
MVGHNNNPQPDPSSQEPPRKEPVPITISPEARALLIKEADYDPSTAKNLKRTDSISWPDYFMAMAFLTAQRSKDPNTQVGACIVDADHRIVGLGYNGFPHGCSDGSLPWDRSNRNPLHNKYLYVCHAEVNAILNKDSADVKGATLYVALFPCQNCAK